MTDISRLAIGWRTVNSQLRERLTELPPEDFRLAVGEGYMPIWAILGHLASTRVYWVCFVLRQPGVESTPFPRADTEGWEDHLDVPRSKDEILDALDRSWAVVERWLEGWSASRLQETVSRTRNGRIQFQSHHLVLVRMITHDAFHAGEVSLILGAHGLEAIDLWSRLELEAAPVTT